MANWTQAEAIELCRKIEAIAPLYGCHVALTGGLLYKDGERKDCDLVFYRIRQWKEINKEGLFAALRGLRVDEWTGWGWCHKARLLGEGNETSKRMDLFFPEEDSATQPAYGEEEMEAANV